MKHMRGIVISSSKSIKIYGEKVNGFFYTTRIGSIHTDEQQPRRDFRGGRMSKTGESAGARLRGLIEGRSSVAAGCFDTLSAKLAEHAGFDALHITGFGVEATLLGTPDMGLVTLTELADVVRRMASAVDIPIICDVDTGFGEIESVARTVQLIEGAGAAAMHIEDVAPPKRNPFVPGQVILPRELAYTRVAAACEARGDSDFVIIARSDSDVVSIDELVDRCNLYLEAGADVAMPVTARVNGRAMHEFDPDEQMEIHRDIVARINGPVLGMAVVPGRTPQDMLDTGYSILIQPMLTLMPAVQAMWNALRAASTGEPRVPGDIATAGDLLDRLGIDTFMERQDRHIARERAGTR
jgi:2-methylisocitrate lyase-like PEP mutase family enzyme